MTGRQYGVDDELQLTDYLRILQRRWIWVVLATTVVVSLSVIVSLVRDPAYTATAQVSLGNSAAQEAIQDALFDNVRTADRELSNEVNVALSDIVHDEVVRLVGVEPDISISADDESDSIRFVSTAGTADESADHANTWAQVYVDTKRREATESIAEAVAVFEADLADLRTERNELRQPLDGLEDDLATATTEEQQALLQGRINRLSAELSTEFELLDLRVQRVVENITQLELNSRLASTGTARVVQVAAPPQDTSNGSLLRNLVLALVVGVVSGGAAAILVESLDRTIKSTEDVASMGVPVLGSIPVPGRNFPEAELPLATMRHIGTPVAEAYQKVRTALEFALLGRQINSLLITSPNQSEGKTTLAVNLAWAMSAVDHRVALVDVDFRRPRVHEIFNCPAQPGLSDNLLAGIPLPQLALRVDEHGSRNLIVIPTGTEPPSPADFVASPAFTSLIRSIESQADLVVLDAPPVLPVSDAPSIGRQVDAVIVTVKAGSTTRDQLMDTLDDLRGVGADVIGVCVVGIRSSSQYGSYEPDSGRARRSRTRSREPKPAVDLREPSEAPIDARPTLAYGAELQAGKLPLDPDTEQA